MGKGKNKTQKNQNRGSRKQEKINLGRLTIARIWNISGKQQINSGKKDQVEVVEQKQKDLSITSTSYWEKGERSRNQELRDNGLDTEINDDDTEEINENLSKLEIAKEIKSLRNGKAVGEDGITAVFLKNLPDC